MDEYKNITYYSMLRTSELLASVVLLPTTLEVDQIILSEYGVDLYRVPIPFDNQRVVAEIPSCNVVQRLIG